MYFLCNDFKTPATISSQKCQETQTETSQMSQETQVDNNELTPNGPPTFSPPPLPDEFLSTDGSTKGQEKEDAFNNIDVPELAAEEVENDLPSSNNMLNGDINESCSYPLYDNLNILGSKNVVDHEKR